MHVRLTRSSVSASFLKTMHTVGPSTVLDLAPVAVDSRTCVKLPSVPATCRRTTLLYENAWGVQRQTDGITIGNEVEAVCFGADGRLRLLTRRKG